VEWVKLSGPEHKLDRLQLQRALERRNSFRQFSLLVVSAAQKVVREKSNSGRARWIQRMKQAKILNWTSELKRFV
jgi:hypothetical protein